MWLDQGQGEQPQWRNSANGASGRGFGKLQFGACAQRREWIVDVNLLGDPAPQCPKDLEAFYTDLSEDPPLLRRAYIPAEASGQVLSLPQ